MSCDDMRQSKAVCSNPLGMSSLSSHAVFRGTSGSAVDLDNVHGLLKKQMYRAKHYIFLLISLISHKQQSKKAQLRHKAKEY